MAAIAALLYLPVFAQSEAKTAPASRSSATAQTASPGDKPTLTVAAGTKIFLMLVRYFSTKSAKPGDAIYLQTVFPVASNGKMLIPAGTYMQGVVQAVTRRQVAKQPIVEVELQSANMIFANGYTIALPTPASPSAAAKPHIPAKERATPSGTYAEVTSDGVVIREGRDPHEEVDDAVDSPPPALGAALSVIFQARGYDDLLDGNAPADMTLPAPLVLDMQRVEQASRVQAANHPPLRPLPPKLCYTPGSPGTGDTVIPGSPGTPDTVIPGIDGGPPTIIPGTPATPPTIIPGIPGTAGSSYPCPR